MGLGGNSQRSQRWSSTAAWAGCRWVQFWPALRWRSAQGGPHKSPLRTDWCLEEHTHAGNNLSYFLILSFSNCIKDGSLISKDIHISSGMCLSQCNLITGDQSQVINQSSAYLDETWQTVPCSEPRSWSWPPAVPPRWSSYWLGTWLLRKQQHTSGPPIQCFTQVGLHQKYVVDP